MHKHYTYAARHFDDSVFSAHNDINPEMYSKMKFGCPQSAKQIAKVISSGLWQTYSDLIIANADRVVLVPSPYNFVPNAATKVTEHVCNHLNRLLVESAGSHVDMTLFHRKVSYISDYGFLSKDKRKGLIDNDQFFINTEFVKDKLLIFIDDVKITGTHEDKLKEIMQEQQLSNTCIFAYYGQYHGTSPEIESKLNFAHVKQLDHLLDMMQLPDYNITVRPLKYLLSQNINELCVKIHTIPVDCRTRIYDACLAEGYYKIPAYQKPLQCIAASLDL